MKSLQQSYSGGAFIYKSSDSIAVFTPEDFSEEHKMIANTAKNFLEKEVRPNNDAIEKQDFTLVKSLLEKAGQLGLLAHSVPEKYGGLGLDKISKGLVGESLGGGGGYSVAHSNHTCIATLPITYFGTESQKEYYLPKLATGEFIGAYCLTEPSAGSDALSAKTTAVLNEEGTHYILNGTKMFITNAAFADTFIVYAKVDGVAFTAFILEKDFPGLSLGPEEQKMGIKSSSTTTVFLGNCEVPIQNLLGEIGKGHHIALNVLNLGRFNLGSACTGAAKHALELVVTYTNQRQQFRKTLASFTATQEKIANMAIRIYTSESIQYRTAAYLEDALGELYDSEDRQLITKRMMEYAAECAICKVYGSETLDHVVDEALQLHGGYGFIREYPIEQMYRDSRINRIFEGANEINRFLIPMSFLKQASKGIISLEKLATEATKELKQPTVFGTDLLSREKEAIITIRNVLLLTLGLAYEKFGGSVGEEQETLIRLADLSIALFAVESAVLRTLKAVEKFGEVQSALKVKLVQGFVDDTILEVEMIARKLILDVASGEKRKVVVGILTEKLGELAREGTGQTKRAIAASIYEAGQFIN